LSGHSTASRAALDRAQAADIRPFDIGRFDKHLAQCRGLDFAQRGDEVLHPHLELGQALVRDAGQGEIDVGHDPAQTDHRGLAA
jgi:hypothetical protein